MPSQRCWNLRLPVISYFQLNALEVNYHIFNDGDDLGYFFVGLIYRFGDRSKALLLGTCSNC
jgi:hypothetical protein